MTDVTRTPESLHPREEPAHERIETSSLAAMLIGASIAELLILRIGTRTAIHIPGIEAVRGPYQVAAAGGRLAFVVAVVLLGLLLVRLTLDLRRRGLNHLSGSIVAFSGTAFLSRVGLVDRGVLAAVTATAVLVLALGVVSGPSRFVAAPIALFAMVFAVGAITRVLYDETNIMSVGMLGWLTLRSEELAILAAICTGPVVRRGLGLKWMPRQRLGWVAGATAVFVIGAMEANPSSAHILMLWNFGLTGGLPAVGYGVAAASLVVAVASAVRHGQPGIAAGLVLVPLGGIVLISTYQSGLAIAGLALAAMPNDTFRAP